MTDRFDVLEVRIKGGEVLGVMGRDLDEKNAEAVINMAVIRRGVEHSFYVTAPAGSLRVGDRWGEGYE